MNATAVLLPPPLRQRVPWSDRVAHAALLGILLCNYVLNSLLYAVPAALT